MERLALSLWIALTAVTLAGSHGRDEVSAPRSFPKLPVPAGNSITEAKGNLARRLFHDKQLSPANDTSCGDCTNG